MSKAQKYIISQLDKFGDNEDCVTYRYHFLSSIDVHIVYMICIFRRDEHQSLAESICTKFPWSDGDWYRGPMSYYK